MRVPIPTGPWFKEKAVQVILGSIGKAGIQTRRWITVQNNYFLRCDNVVFLCMKNGLGRLLL